MSGAPEAPERRAGRLLGGRYRLAERLDEGGAGEVWRARDERLDREVAVKLLGAGADEAFRERFAEEARRAAAIGHPNVVTVFDEGRDGPEAYMVMEYVRGRTLRDVIAERGALPLHEAARLVAQVAAALDAAHAAGVVHCDVKPANVILDEHGLAKLADFGVARAARGPAEHELIGTPRYIAPERIEGQAPTARSDVYSLGLVAYELIAGRPAFEAMDTDDLLRHRLEGPPPSLRSVRPGVPERVDAVIARALSRDPERRHASAGELSRALLESSEGDDTRTVQIGLPRPLRRRPRLPALDATIAVLAVILVLLGVVLLFMRFPEIAPGAAPTPTPAAETTPNVVGMELREAVRLLLGSGYAPVSWDFAGSPGGARPCSVLEQTPEAGTPLRRGPASLLYVAGTGCTQGIGR